LVVAIIGTILTGLSVIWHSFPVFILGMLIFGLGMGAAQQLRLAAADMYPPSRRAEGLGFVLTGSLLGALGGPVVINVAQSISPGLGLPSLATPWLIVPVVIVPTIVLIARLKPDPKYIAAHLDDFYPGYKPELPVKTGVRKGVGLGVFLRHHPKRAAILASLATQGNMSMVMAMGSLALSHHGHALPAISFSVAIHVIGMFGLSMPLGRLGDAVGRRSVLLIGVVSSILGTLLVPASPDYWVVTFGMFLVGLGWSGINVAATTVIADTTRPHERGRAIGTNDAFSSASGIVLPLLAGPLVEIFGLGAISILGVLAMIVPLPTLLRLRESSPGKYEDDQVSPDRRRS
ncbi:MAG: MFS transporter, partial [Dehalococcoidia bacterium]|nr:MFS transporter [Dehalococcoidia bacterium]